MSAPKPPQKKKPSAIDLFSGCGGLTTGLRLAGYSVKAAVEIEQKAQQTYRLNHPRVHLYCNDIRDLTITTVLRDLLLKPGDLDLLAGCPPCQGFSRLRTRNKANSVDDPRNDLVHQFLRFVRGLRPKTLMLENVPALARDSRFLKLTLALKKLGYKTTTSVLDASDYGVAQRRKRLILLGSRVHHPEIAPKAKKIATVKDAFARVGDPPSRTTDKLHALPANRSESVMSLIRLIPKDGGSRRDLPKELLL